MCIRDSFHNEEEFLGQSCYTKIITTASEDMGNFNEVIVLERDNLGKGRFQHG